MTNHSEKGVQERFADSYRHAMNQITVSPALRQRILTAAPEKKTSSVKIIRIAATAAACLVVVLAAGKLLNSGALSGISSMNMTADTAPAGAVDEAGVVEAAEGAEFSEAAKAAETAEIAEAETEDTAEAAAEDAAPEDGAERSTFSLSIEPYALEDATDEAADDRTVSCASPEEAAELLGWSTDFRPEQAYSVSVLGGELLQLTWEGGWYRQAENTRGADISGDDSDYPFVAQTEDYTVKGADEEHCHLILWQDAQYSYAYYTDEAIGLTKITDVIR